MLEWKDSKDCNGEGLYLVYRNGYPLIVVEWKCGYGYIDIRTGLTVQPFKLAKINLP